MRTLAILFLFFLSACEVKKELEVISLNNQAVSLMEKDSIASAQEKLIDALARRPFEPVIHNNMGVSLDAAKEIERALIAYRAAAEKADQAKNPQVQFVTRFNYAQALAKQGKVDDAIEWYQKALAIDPASIETKTNIELLAPSQNQQGGGQGKDQEDQQQKQDEQDGKDNENGKDKQKDQTKGYSENPKPKPKPFQGELKEEDVKKILGELKQQEQRIRTDYNRKEAKEPPRDKDW